MDWLTADDINACIDFLAVCLLVVCHLLGWIAGGFR